MLQGFFSMTFFGFDSSHNAWAHSGMVWVWFVVTIPITVIGIILFSWRHSKQSFYQFVKNGLDRALFLKAGDETDDDE